MSPLLGLRSSTRVQEYSTPSMTPKRLHDFTPGKSLSGMLLARILEVQAHGGMRCGPSRRRPVECLNLGGSTPTRPQSDPTSTLQHEPRSAPNRNGSTPGQPNISLSQCSHLGGLGRCCACRSGAERMMRRPPPLRVGSTVIEQIGPGRLQNPALPLPPTNITWSTSGAHTSCMRRVWAPCRINSSGAGGIRICIVSRRTLFGWRHDHAESRARVSVRRCSCLTGH